MAPRRGKRVLETQEDEAEEPPASKVKRSTPEESGVAKVEDEGTPALGKALRVYSGDNARKSIVLPLCVHGGGRVTKLAAILDTGASVAMISPKVANKLRALGLAKGSVAESTKLVGVVATSSAERKLLLDVNFWRDEGKTARVAALVVNGLVDEFIFPESCRQQFGIRESGRDGVYSAEYWKRSFRVHEYSAGYQVRACRRQVVLGKGAEGPLSYVEARLQGTPGNYLLCPFDTGKHRGTMTTPTDLLVEIPVEGALVLDIPGRATVSAGRTVVIEQGEVIGTLLPVKSLTPEELSAIPGMTGGFGKSGHSQRGGSDREVEHVGRRVVSSKSIDSVQAKEALKARKFVGMADWNPQDLVRIGFEGLEEEHPGAKEKAQEIVRRHVKSMPNVKDHMMPICNLTKVRLEVKEGAEPVSLSPYQNSPIQQLAVNADTDGKLLMGIIRPSKSPWAAPLFPIWNGKRWRCVVDYRELNKALRKNAFPLPRMDMLIQKLGVCGGRGPQIVSSLDLSSFFYALELTEESKHLTAFCVPNRGLYEYNRVPLGVTIAPAVAQWVIQTALGDDLLNSPVGEKEGWCVACFIDDVVIGSATMEKHLELVERVFERLGRANLPISPKKTSLLQRSLEFLGAQVGRDGVGITKDKAKCVREWQLGPTSNRKALRQFLGLAQWVRKWVKGFSHLAAPLTSLLRDDPKEKEGSSKGGTKSSKEFRRRKERIAFGSKWTELHKECFDALKEAICSAPVLATPAYDPDPGKLRFRITCDASCFGIGSVLEQLIDGEWRVLEYGGRAFSAQEANWHPSEQECYAIMFSLEKWRHLVAASPIVVKSDHKNLKPLLVKPIKGASGYTSHRWWRWACKLSMFDYKLEHIAGVKNFSDGISRMPHFAKAGRVSRQGRFRNALDGLKKGAPVVRGQMELSKRTLEEFLEEGLLFQISRGIGVDEGTTLDEVLRKQATPSYPGTRCRRVREICDRLWGVQEVECSMVRRTRAEGRANLRKSKKVSPKPKGRAVRRSARLRDKGERTSGAKVESVEEDAVRSKGKASGNLSAGESTKVEEDDDVEVEESIGKSVAMGVGRGATGSGDSDLEQSKPVEDDPQFRMYVNSAEFMGRESTFEKYISTFEKDWSFQQQQCGECKLLNNYVEARAQQMEAEEAGNERVAASHAAVWRKIAGKQSLRTTAAALKGLLRVGGVLMHEDALTGDRRYVVPKAMREALVWEHHGSPLRCHPGTRVTMRTLSPKVWWPNMERDVKKVITHCVHCRMENHAKYRAMGHLLPRLYAYPFRDVGVDTFSLGFTSAQGNCSCLTIVDLYTRWVIMVPLVDKRASTVARALYERLVLVFGVPENVHSDGGSEFEGEFAALLRAVQTKMSHSVPWYSPGNGQVEVMHKQWRAFLRKHLSARGGSLTALTDGRIVVEQLLMEFCHAHNTSPTAEEKYSPYHLLFGRCARSVDDLVQARSLGLLRAGGAHLKELLGRLREVREDYGEVRVKVQKARKGRSDATRYQQVFEVGDKVLLYRPELHNAVGHDVLPPVVGPCVVVKVEHGKVYTLEVPTKGGETKEVRAPHFHIVPCPEDVWECPQQFTLSVGPRRKAEVERVIRKEVGVALGVPREVGNPEKEVGKKRKRKKKAPYQVGWYVVLKTNREDRAPKLGKIVEMFRTSPPVFEVEVFGAKRVPQGDVRIGELEYVPLGRNLKGEEVALSGRRSGVPLKERISTGDLVIRVAPFRLGTDLKIPVEAVNRLHRWY